MRILLFYDLPSVESYEKKEYSNFRKNLLKNGYIMMQFSIYVKCVCSPTLVEQEINRLKKILHSEGNIRVLCVTEKQYQDMKIMIGNKKINEIYNNDKRYIKI